MANDMTPAFAGTPSLGLIPDGLYFGLPDRLYHADPALGSGSVRDLAACPLYYWQSSVLNKDRQPEAESPALLFGRALHALVLEGREAFERGYICAPDKSEHPGALDLQDELKARCAELGLPVSGTKAVLVSRILEVDPEAVIWANVVDRINRKAAETGASILTRDQYEKVILGAGYIASNPAVAATFQGGRSEVSIFWTDNGVRCKARLDYMRLGRRQDRIIGLITDLKSFSAMGDDAPEKAVVKAICNTRLDVQAAHYLNGAQRIPEFIAAGKVTAHSGAMPAAEWLAAFAKLEPLDWSFYWNFFSKDAPISLLRSVDAGSTLVQFGAGTAARAIDLYREYMAAYGESWRFVDPIADTTVTLEDMPPWFGK